MDIRSDTGFGYNMSKWIQSFWIGVVESVKKLKAVEPELGRGSMITSLIGRPGMSIRTKEELASTRVKLGRHLSSNEGKNSEVSFKATFVRLGWLIINF
jgi:hypothetical protein